MMFNTVSSHDHLQLLAAPLNLHVRTPSKLSASPFSLWSILAHLDCHLLSVDSEMEKWLIVLQVEQL